jgi:hypothetical protein
LRQTILSITTDGFWMIWIEIHLTKGLQSDRIQSGLSST